MNQTFDPTAEVRNTRNALSSVIPNTQSNTRNLDMLAAVAVARQNREREGNNETAEIREYMATLPFRGISRAATGANPQLDTGLSAQDAIEL